MTANNLHRHVFQNMLDITWRFSCSNHFSQVELQQLEGPTMHTSTPFVCMSIYVVICIMCLWATVSYIAIYPFQQASPVVQWYSLDSVWLSQLPDKGQVQKTVHPLQHRPTSPGGGREVTGKQSRSSWASNTTLWAVPVHMWKRRRVRINSCGTSKCGREDLC